MSKFVILILVALVAVTQGFPLGEGDDAISNAAAKGDWDLVHSLIKSKFNDKSIWEPSFSSGSVRSLKPSPGGHVYGESEVSFHSSSNVNGKKSENSGGHKVINQDGKVEEFDFNPKF